MSLTPAATAALSRLEFFGIKLGLDSIRTLLQALGEPQQRFPTVLVAGTNGKGSTSSLLASIAHHGGLRVGLYTSPHLESPRERVRIAGRTIPSAELSAVLREIIEVAERVLGAPPTYFEAFTAAACRVFAAHAVDLAVLEVGMGGRLDATNACEPVLSVITPIGLDHQQYLGETLTAIAGEKAGILRHAQPALAWVPASAAEAAVEDAAVRLGARLEMVHKTTRVRGRETFGLDGQTLDVETPVAAYRLRTSLLGEHQLANVALAVRAAEHLRALGFSGLDEPAIAGGVSAARWPGRLESVRLADGGEVLFDGAHNADGVAALAAFLDRLGRPHDLLFGALADKDLEAMLPPLAARARRVTLTSVPSPRSESPSRLRSLLGDRQAVLETDPGKALDSALAGARTHLKDSADAQSGDFKNSTAVEFADFTDSTAVESRPDATPRLLVICGSLYLVGALREALRRRHGAPPAAEDLALC